MGDMGISESKEDADALYDKASAIRQTRTYIKRGQFDEAANMLRLARMKFPGSNALGDGDDDNEAVFTKLVRAIPIHDEVFWPKPDGNDDPHPKHATCKRKDGDNYIASMGKVLTRAHEMFFSEYDRAESAEERRLLTLPPILESIKSEVFSGCCIYFA